MKGKTEKGYKKPWKQGVPETDFEDRLYCIGNWLYRKVNKATTRTKSVFVLDEKHPTPRVVRIAN